MERTFNLDAAAFTGSLDLASAIVGGKVLIASDDFFAEKENLIKPGRSIFIEDKFTERGKWMDGWESRRKREIGHDWVIIKLGVPGVICGVDIDTNHFLGNSPAYASIDACKVLEEKENSEPAAAKLAEDNIWHEVLPRVPLKNGVQNIFGIASGERWTHIRLNIHPDGGVARLRIYGTPLPDWEALTRQGNIDLASCLNGGQAVAASDMFFGNKDNLIMPGRAINMGGGWETKRRRGPGQDWIIVKLGKPGLLDKIEVDTHHFKGNYPDRCFIDAVYAPNEIIDLLNWHTFTWTGLLAETKLQADTCHSFEKELLSRGPWTHLRLTIIPDGGVSRMRVFGTPA